MIKNIFVPVNYKDCVENYEDICGSTRYFAAANTPEGFISYFRDIFGVPDITKLYILGGGPGSGKSTILKRIAYEAHNREMPCEMFHCSSSPFSLDGIKLPTENVAVIDGTAPHTYDISLPGAREHFIDLGIAWNTGMLEKRVSDIKKLRDEKKRAYRRAYLHLKTYRLLEDESQRLLEPYILKEKMSKYAKSFSDKYIKKGKDFLYDIRIQSGIGSSGCVFFDSFEFLSSNVFRISDFRDIGYTFISMLFEEAKRKNTRCVVSFSPVDNTKIDGIYFPDTDTCVSFYAENFNKNINCERFCDMKSLRNIKPKFDISHKSAYSVFNEACESLKDAGSIHDSIEKLYYPCTDYSVIEGITDTLLSKIF